MVHAFGFLQAILFTDLNCEAMKYELDKIKNIVIDAAQTVLMPYYSRVERSYKTDGSVVTEADHAMQHHLREQLLMLYPQTVLLGEEMSADEQAQILGSDIPIWCLDPLDGTNNFTCGIPYFSVSLALIMQGRVLLGIVYDPLRDECFAASREQGSSLNGQELKITEIGVQMRQAIAIIDFKRLSGELATRLVNEIPYASQRSFGSVALDWCWLAAGRGHLYLHGRSNIWDYAAGQFIFSRAGGYSSTLQGEPVFTDSLIPRSAIAAGDRDLFDAWSQWLMKG
jgi:myo-inositol-1(or 4)-monophosphatase